MRLHSGARQLVAPGPWGNMGAPPQALSEACSVEVHGTAHRFVIDRVVFWLITRSTEG